MAPGCAGAAGAPHPEVGGAGAAPGVVQPDVGGLAGAVAWAIRIRTASDDAHDGEIRAMMAAQPIAVDRL